MSHAPGARGDDVRHPVHLRMRELLRRLRRDPGLLVLVAAVYVLLPTMRAVITLVPLRRITGRLGAPNLETAKDDLPDDQLRYARRVGWAIRKLAPRTPTNSNCYPQALTAWWLLHRRGVPTTFYYGAAFDPDGTALQAHVWLRCGRLIVTGGGTSRRFAPLTWFGDLPDPRGPRLPRRLRT